MCDDPSRYGKDNWVQYYAEEAAVRAGVSAPVPDVIERIVNGNIGIEDRFRGTEQQRAEGNDSSYERRLDDDVSDEFDL